jgi:hypothetical protein
MIFRKIYGCKLQITTVIFTSLFLLTSPCSTRQMTIVIPRTAEKIVGYVICNSFAFYEVLYWAVPGTLRLTRNSRDSWGRRRRLHQRAVAAHGTPEQGPLASSDYSMGSWGTLTGSHQRDNCGQRKRKAQHIWCCYTGRAVHCHSEGSWGRAPGSVLQGTCRPELQQQPR